MGFRLSFYDIPVALIIVGFILVAIEIGTTEEIKIHVRMRPWQWVGLGLIAVSGTILYVGNCGGGLAVSEPLSLINAK